MSSGRRILAKKEELLTSRGAPTGISVPISFQHPFNRAGGRTSNVLPRNRSDMKIEFPCPVCGHDSFGGEPPGSFGICSVCGWEDDPSQIRHPRMRGGANTGSIFDYQQESNTWRITEADVRDPDW